jgi:hypothetical protein
MTKQIIMYEGDWNMTTNSREAIMQLNRDVISREYSMPGYERPQEVYVSKPSRPAAGVWAAAIAMLLTVGYAIRQLIHQGAPAGESNFPRQML